MRGRGRGRHLDLGVHYFLVELLAALAPPYGEGGPADYHLVDEAAEGPVVDLPGVAFSGEHLGGHVFVGTADRSGALRLGGEAEVGQEDVALTGEEDVLGL